MAIDTTEKRKRGRPRNEDENNVNAELLREIANKGLIDRSSQSPLWVQLKNAIAECISQGQLFQGERLPSEQSMCEIFNVSRPVVRSALRGLADEGLLMQVPRRGIFVAKPKPRMETNFLTSNVSVHSDLEARGHHVTSQTFEFRRTEPDPEEMRVFSLPPNGTVVRVGRIYLSDGRPITHTLISLPGHKVPEMENLDIADHSIFQILKDNYGLVSQRAERWFTATNAEGSVAQRLEVPVGQPLIAIESIAFDTNDAPLEYYRAFYNSMVARIHVSTGTFKN